jgi:hypothetical protein
MAAGKYCSLCLLSLRKASPSLEVKINCSLSYSHDALLYAIDDMECWKYHLRYTGCVPLQNGQRVFIGVNFVAQGTGRADLGVLTEGVTGEIIKQIC